MPQANLDWVPLGSGGLRHPATPGAMQELFVRLSGASQLTLRFRDSAINALHTATFGIAGLSLVVSPLIEKCFVEQYGVGSRDY